MAVALALVLSATAAAAGRHAEGIPRCATPYLVVWLEPSAGAAAGSAHYRLGFTNLSGHACMLRGFPGVSAVTLVGAKIGKAAARGTSTAHPVRLEQTQTASAALRVVNAGNYPASRCRPVVAAGLRVYPPGDTVSKLIPFPLRTCRKAGAAILTVSAVTRGPG